MKTYEALLIFPSSLNEEALDKALGRVKEEMAKLAAIIIEARVLGKRLFARPLKKHESGQYARIEFNMPPAAVSALLARLKLIEELFRVQIVVAGEQKEAAEPVKTEAEADG